MEDITKIINFLRLIEKFKTIERFNKTSNLSRPESDAEHTWHLVMMVYLLGNLKPKINKNKAMEMALVHDLMEIYAGDVNLWDNKGITKKEKEIREEEAANRLFAELPSNEGKKLINLWEEYEERKTAEAVFVYALDKLQPFLQRLITKDNGWKEKQVDITKLKNVKPKEVIEDPLLSQLWDDFLKEAEDNNLLYKG